MDVFLFGAKRRQRELRSSADLLWSLAGSPFRYGPSTVNILTKRYGQCHASSLLLFTRCKQALSVPNVLDCHYRPALKSCCEAVGTAQFRPGLAPRMRHMDRIGP